MLKLQSQKGAWRWWRLVLTVLAVLAFVAIVAFLAYQITRPIAEFKNDNPHSKTAKSAVTTQSVSSKIMVTGDVFFSRFTNAAAMKSDLKYAYPFARLNEFHRENYDAWVGDMECPVTNLPQPTADEEETTLSFNCSAKYLPEMSKYFDAMTLANNHTDNRGVEGFEQTQNNLAENGVQYFGSYDPEDYDNLCDVISLPARVKFSDNSVKKADLPLAFCGYHGVFQIPTQRSVDEITKFAKYMPTIALPHSGAEYKAGPDQIKTTLYRSMIDAGADVVIGDHAHWVQSSEAYEGHLILYSLGNFMFDQQFNNEVTRSVALVMDVTADQKDNPDLTKWLSLAGSCKEYRDTCIEKAAAENLKPLKLSYRFSIVGSDNLGRQTHPATDAQLASMKQRLNWSETITGLTGQFSGRD
jgi:Putative enzyme of poly-gamma-glutamate biosynthesis (capsule formation)